MGDDIALVGYPDAHARLDPSFRNGKEVFDRDLLDMRIVTEEIVVKNHNAVGRRLAQLKLTDHGCFLNRVIRSQIEMPIDDNVCLIKAMCCRSAAMPDELKPLPTVSALSRFTVR